MVLAVLAALLSAVQDPSPASQPASRPISIALQAAPADARPGLDWSPKGAKSALTKHEGSLVGSFALGPRGTKEVAVRLAKSGADKAHFDLLFVDLDRDGAFGDGERLATEPKDQRGKWWSSFDATVTIPVPGERGAPASRAYPIALWFVEDPQEPDAAPLLRWTRRGWHEGSFVLDGKPAFALITEMELDGVFDQRDSWALARDPKALRTTPARDLDTHAWLDGVAYRPLRIDPHGLSLAIERFDPGITEAEEMARADRYAVDRAAPRAARPLAFGRDLAAAFARAKAERKRVLVDFETTWCGPCKLMDQIVYTAAPVVDAARDVIAVKLDGDEQRELVKRHRVAAYPTILLFDADGTELRRAVGYRSVAELVRLLAR